MKIKRLAVLAAMAIAILGVIVPVRFANAYYMMHESPTYCMDYRTYDFIGGDPYFGGTDYCKYGALRYYFPKQSDEQIFVIGTDWSVWTRWEELGGVSATGRTFGHDYTRILQRLQSA